MKRIFKPILNVCVALVACLGMQFFTSCNDDMAPESYYTFTGETMSDYLNKNSNFSMFAQIVNRSKSRIMDLLSSRGAYTMFPPTNEAVELYLKENGYKSVDEISPEYCDTLVYSHMINYVYSTNDFSDETTYLNMNELPLSIRVDTTALDENNMAVMTVNTDSRIINSLKNDSVENGIVHPIDHMIVPNTDLGGSLLESAKSEFEIYYAAFLATGLIDSLDMQYMDMDYEADVESGKYPEFIYDLHSGGSFSEGQAGYEYVAKRPDHRYSGFTVFVVPDKYLKEKYSINTDDVDEGLKQLYELAVETYTPVASSLGITEADKQRCWKSYDQMTEENFKDTKNPLYLMMAYHILDRYYMGQDKFVNRWGTNTQYTDPTDWINTMLPYSTLKIEHVFSTMDPFVEVPGGIYLNHGSTYAYGRGERVRGAYVTTPPSNTSLNCAYYYIDEIVSYDQKMQNTIMNDRIRMDIFSLFPELTTNNIRLNGDPRQPYNASYDNSDTDFRNGINYYTPVTYLKNTKVSDNTILFWQRGKLPWWNWGGDEMNIFGSSYDFTFRLPSVPAGEYEIRLGYAAGFWNRGIAQIYYNDKPQGLPVDMRIKADDSSVGGKYTDMTDEEIAENKQVMKNNGYYKAPKSIYAIYNNLSSKQPGQYIAADCGNLYDVNYCYRRIVCKVKIDPATNNTLRLRSVYTSGSNSCVMLDYLELVPNSICGVGGLGEDDN